MNFSVNGNVAPPCNLASLMRAIKSPSPMDTEKRDQHGETKERTNKLKKEKKKEKKKGGDGWRTVVQGKKIFLNQYVGL